MTLVHLLEQATHFCSRRWFPTNPIVVQRIRDGINAGRYVSSPASFIEDIKGDVALCSHFFTGGYLPAPSPSEANLSFSLRLSRINAEECAKKLVENVSSFTTFSLSDLNEVQAQTLRYMVTCATAVEVIARRKGIDQEKAFTCVLLRQLGYALIAFNYPSILRQALRIVQENGGMITQALESLLGYNPLLLSLKLTELGQVAKDIQSLVSNEPTVHLGEDNNQDAILLEYCKTAEALAQADCPDAFPAAHARWQEIEQELIKSIGKEGFREIQVQVRQRLQVYTTFSPSVFSALLDPSRKESAENATDGVALLRKSPYCSSLAKEFYKHFEKLYRLVTPGRISSAALNELVAETIPNVGFSGGCLYLFRISDRVLVPRLRLGRMLLSSYRDIPLSLGGPLGQSIADALSSKDPIIETGVVLHGRALSHISGPLTKEGEVGVLHLELGPQAEQYKQEDLEKLFFALREAFVCVLDIDKSGRRPIMH